MGIDFQGLLAVHSAAEAEPNLIMATWARKTPCGTSHCMIGAFCHRVKDPLQLSVREIPTMGDLEMFDAIVTRFGITQYEANWLFGIAADGWQSHWRWTQAAQLEKPEALARLRKFIYYKLHKQEMIVENNDKNRSIELPRNVSGRRSVVMAQSA